MKPARGKQKPLALGARGNPAVPPNFQQIYNPLISEADNGAEPELDTETGAESAYPIPIR